MEVAIGAAIGAGVGYVATGEAEGALIGAGVGAIGGYAVGAMGPGPPSTLGAAGTGGSGGVGAGVGAGAPSTLGAVGTGGSGGVGAGVISSGAAPNLAAISASGGTGTALGATGAGTAAGTAGFFGKMGTTLAKVSKVATPLMLAGSLLTAGSGVAGAYGAAGQADVEAMYSDRQAVQQELARLDEKDRRVRRYLKDKSDVENYYAGVGLRSDVGSPLVVTSDYFYTLQKDLRAIDMVGYGKIEGYQKEAQTFRTYADRTRKAAPYEAAGQVLSTAGRALI